MIITSSDCFEILRVINKMEIKKDLIKSIIEIVKVQAKVDKVQGKLLAIAQKEEKELRQVVEENIDLAEKFENLDSEMKENMIEIVFTIVENIPKAEQEVYKVLSKLNNCPIKEVKEWEADKLILAIKEIATSESFQRFFSSMTK